MSLFLFSVVALIALALLLVLPPLLVQKPLSVRDPGAADARRANLRVLREQLAALEAEHLGGALDQEQYTLARIEIERRALDEEHAGERPVVVAPAGKTALALGLFVPLFALGVYAVLGSAQALIGSPKVAAADHSGEVSPAQMEAMVEKLAKRLESKTTPEAGDLQAWTMLARSYGFLQRFADAARAYARASALAPQDAQLVADHADMLAMAQGKTLAGEPSRLIERALALDGKNIKVLALAGSAAFERKDFASALKYWGQAQQLLPPGSESANEFEGNMQQARAAASGGAQIGAAAPVAPPASAVPQGATNATGVVAGAPAAGQTSGVVRLAGALAAKVAPTDTLYVFARAAQGPRMPLAILKRTAGELPFTFTLDDSSAMSPEMKLSRFPSVVVGARISRSGDAVPHSGDLVGQVGPVDTGSGKLVIVIDSVQP